MAQKRLIATSEAFTHTSDLVRFINRNKITKDDIISVLSLEDMLFLIYYYDKNSTESERND